MRKENEEKLKKKLKTKYTPFLNLMAPQTQWVI